MFKNRSKNNVQGRFEDAKSPTSESKEAAPKPRPLDLTELAKVVGGTQAPKGGWSAR